MTTTLLNDLEKYAVDRDSIVRSDNSTPIYRTPVKDFYFKNVMPLKTSYVTKEDFQETIPATIPWVSERGEQSVAVGGEQVSYEKMKAPMLRLNDDFTADEYAEISNSAYKSQLMEGKAWIDRKYQRAQKILSRVNESLCAQSASGSIVHKIKAANNKYEDYTITLGTVADKTTPIFGGVKDWDTATLASILGDMQKVLKYYQDNMPGNEMAKAVDLVFNVHDNIFDAVLAKVNAQATTEVLKTTYDYDRTITFSGGFRMRREDFTYYPVTVFGAVGSATKALPTYKCQVINMNENGSRLVYLKWNNFTYAKPGTNAMALRMYRYAQVSTSGNMMSLNHISRPFPLFNTTKSLYIQVDS